MNRVQKRAYIRNIRGIKGLKRKHAKGAFGSLPLYLQELRKQEWEKKAQKYAKTVVSEQPETIENKEDKEITP